MTLHGLHETQDRDPKGASDAHAGVLQDPADVDLEKRVAVFLHSQGRFALQRIEVVASGGDVTLKGSVHSYYEKQLCLECAKHVAGVTRLVDLIEVESTPTEKETLRWLSK